MRKTHLLDYLSSFLGVVRRRFPAVESALPRLRETVAPDTAVCPGWWRVTEEAEDAIEWIHGRAGKTRVPISIESEL